MNSQNFSVLDTIAYPKLSFGEQAAEGVLYFLRGALGGRRITFEKNLIKNERITNLFVRIVLFICALIILPLTLIALAAKKLYQLKNLTIRVEFLHWYQIGLQARAHLLSLKIISPNNFENSYIRAHGSLATSTEFIRKEYEEKLKALRATLGRAPTETAERLAFIAKVSKAVVEAGVGNCGELSCVAAQHILKNHPGVRAKIFKLKSPHNDTDHAFIMIGSKEAGVRVIYDPWSDSLFSTTIIEKHLKNYQGLDSNGQPILRPFNPSDHSLISVLGSIRQAPEQTRHDKATP